SSGHAPGRPPWPGWPVRAIALGTVIAVALVACADDDDQSSSFDAATATEAPARDGDEQLAAATEETVSPADTAPTEPAVGALGGAEIAGSDLANLGRDIAIEMQVTMTTEDLRRTVQGIRQSAAAHGGAVFASDIDYGNADGSGADGNDTDEPAPTGRATLTVKVPPAELGAVLSGLDELGTVLSTNQQAQDVTDQLVDLSVRIRNAEQSVDRVREFLEATTDLRQMVDLEGELTRRQTDLERLLATQANLTERVALSTLTIDVYPATAAPDPVDDADDGIGDAFRSGWDAFLGALFAIGFVLAILTPFLALAAVVLAIAWIVVKPRRRRPAGAGAAVTTAAAPEAAGEIRGDVSVDEDLARTSHPG
ncbi:MAG TPA: DUF4349 domain-containing protein, partial [Ilumatobacteraceae bacterium]|nr:DUF4349 domain-containing protein [Ilumatobacteraceae bacterium]